MVNFWVDVSFSGGMFVVQFLNFCHSLHTFRVCLTATINATQTEIKCNFRQILSVILLTRNSVLAY